MIVVTAFKDTAGLGAALPDAYFEFAKTLRNYAVAVPEFVNGAK